MTEGLRLAERLSPSFFYGMKFRRFCLEFLYAFIWRNRMAGNKEKLNGAPVKDGGAAVPVRAA